MSEEIKAQIDPRDSLVLKLPELDVSSEEPWGDDVLDRQQIAGRLTNLVRDQSTPLTSSIHGHWGTGKTFMLKRWQKDLEGQGFKAIYFNAWEDDFCDDPFLAMIGQLAEHFKGDRFKELTRKAVETAIPLIRENLLGVLRATTGVTVRLDDQQQGNKTPLDAYLEQRATKDSFKNQLGQLAAEVARETGHPLVFIVDELDRCRPTFAIELLERVKHLFDVPNLVFVFGINRDELCKSLQSIYGEIDAGVYLRRFFDMEFTLPEVDSVTFGNHLVQKYGLDEFFGALSKNTTPWLPTNEIWVLAQYFPALWGRLGLSLRDIDYCVRSIALVSRNLDQRYHMHPWLLGLLITLKLKNPTLYKQFIQGNCLVSEVINYIDRTAAIKEIDRTSAHALLAIEAYLYRTEAGFDGFASKVPTALGQLQLLTDGKTLTHPGYLSEKTQKEGLLRAGQLVQMIKSWASLDFIDVVGNLAALIDLHQNMVRD